MKRKCLLTFNQSAILISIAAAIVGCDNGSRVKFTPPPSCTTAKVGTVTTISCPDGTGTTINDGTSCSTSTIVSNFWYPSGGTLIVCTDGTTSLISNGLNGLNGARGPQGNPGVDGSSGTVMTPVQFCPNVKPTYPSAFPEVGFCLNGQIWGVYSANGGFLSYLPNGTYSSNGVNASCNFTIGDNCSISN